MTNRIMYDSVNVRGIPRIGGKLIAYYIDADYATDPELVNELFPDLRHVPIDANGTRAAAARVADVENADIRPEDTERWIAQFNGDNPAYHTGGRAVIYCNRSTIPAVRAGTGRYILGRDYYLWVAAPGSMFGPGQLKGVIACQNVWARTYNSSVVFSDQWLPN